MTVPSLLSRTPLLLLLAVLVVAVPASAWSQDPFRRTPPPPATTTTTSKTVSRREALVASIATAGASAWWGPSPAHASNNNNNNSNNSPETKLRNLSNDELSKFIVQDIEQGQFMVRADLTRAIYDESATFTDEIDTYQLDQWIQGTKRLFVADQSHVDLVANTLLVSTEQVTYSFTELLTFNIPLVRPKVYLSGKVVLKRDPSSGLIVSYQEQWDQSVNDVLKNAKLFGA